MIYYVNVQTSYYKEFSTHKLYGELEIQEEGEDFFTVACKNTDFLIHPEDRARIKLFLDKDYLLSQLETSRQLTEDYRMIMDGKEAQYTRMTVRWSSDKTHFIICVENREDYVKKEKEHLQAISLANEIARRDSLTGTRNITAFHEYEKELQNLIDGKEDSSFGIIMCDLNNLKVINDTQGHKAGDEYIKNACKLICRIFSHSPVFRVGGDEFAVIVKDQDYVERENLLLALRHQVEENIRIGSGPVIASGLADYQPNSDKVVEDIYNRADGRMYEEKTRLKDFINLTKS